MILKWAGGKRQLLPKILPLIPDDIETYWEPFFGGGAVHFALQEKGAFKQAWVSDINKDLFCVFNVIKDNPKKLISLLSTYINTKEEYYKVRALEPKEEIECAARMIYLNRLCFNGLYRVNKSGKFNVPYGKYKNPTICNVEKIMKTHNAMKNTIFTCHDWHFPVQHWLWNEKDFFYFDPPYLKISDTSFTKYSKNDFTLEDHKKLAVCMFHLRDYKIKALLSNADVPVAHKLYEGLNIDIVQARRNINRDKDGRGKVNELLVRNY